MVFLHEHATTGDGAATVGLIEQAGEGLVNREAGAEAA